MKQKVAIGIIAVALLGGSATGLVVREVRADDARPAAADASPSASEPTPTPTATASASGDGDAEVSEKIPDKPTDPSRPTLLPLGSMQITTGAVGPVRVGMTTAEAVDTGYFNADVPSELCEVAAPLEWKSNYFNALDVYVGQDSTITTIGVRGRGPTTRSGLAVNSSYGDVQQVIGDKEPQSAGYGQTGLFVNDGDAWIGFLFDSTPELIDDSQPVTFIEVTRGRKPNLMRDGC